jgi:general secretion pathway protein K
MKLQTHASSGGIALIIVMIVIIVLGIMAGGFAYSMKVETTLARRANADPDLEWLGRSGVELARYILAQPVPNEPFDALNQKWAGGPGSYTANNLPMGGVPDPLSQISLENNQLGAGHFSIKITDLERKANVNLADQGLLQQALFLVGVDPSSMSTIIDSVLDWRDPDDNPHINGTESEYYLKQDPPYVAKNGPIDDLSELLLIRGITPEMYFGHEDKPALADALTARSRGTVNINTASQPVLSALGLSDAEISNIVQERTNNPYPTVPGRFSGRRMTVGSTTFRIDAAVYDQPFVTVLRARKGEFIGWNVSMPPWPVEFPEFPPEPQMEPSFYDGPNDPPYVWW